MHVPVKRYTARFYPTDPDKGPYTARNHLLLFKDVAKWMAKEKLWYAKGGGSVLSDVKIPDVPKLGRKPYSDAEVNALVKLASESSIGLRDRAIWLPMLGCMLRSGEVRTLLRTDYVSGRPGEAGHLVIRSRRRRSPRAGHGGRADAGTRWSLAR